MKSLVCQVLGNSRVCTLLMKTVLKNLENNYLGVVVVFCLFYIRFFDRVQYSHRHLCAT
jgi:hypothetical protein